MAFARKFTNFCHSCCHEAIAKVFQWVRCVVFTTTILEYFIETAQNETKWKKRFKKKTAQSVHLDVYFQRRDLFETAKPWGRLTPDRDAANEATWTMTFDMLAMQARQIVHIRKWSLVCSCSRLRSHRLGQMRSLVRGVQHARGDHHGSLAWHLLCYRSLARCDQSQY